MTVLRIAGEVAPVARADLDHPPFQPGEQPGAVLGGAAGVGTVGGERVEAGELRVLHSALVWRAVELLLVGGGKMGEALLGGLLAAGREVAVVEVFAPRREELAAKYPQVKVVEAPIACDGAVLVVKPADVASAARAAVEAGTRRLLSVAAGITTRAIEDAIGQDLPVVRAMPNTPALVGAGAAAISPGTHAGEDDLAWAEAILGAVGMVERVPEKLQDAVTGVSGSGPAYIFLVAEALAEAGVLAGSPPRDRRGARLPDAARLGQAARRERREPRPP